MLRTPAFLARHLLSELDAPPELPFFSALKAKADEGAFTRATAATVIDFEGLLKACKSGEMRFQGARRVENLLRFSQDFSQPEWVKLGNGAGLAPTVTANFSVAPDGSQTASRIQFNSGGMAAADRSEVKQTFTNTLTKTAVTSIYLKTNDGSTKTITLEGGFSTTVVTPLTVTSAWQRFGVTGGGSVDIRHRFYLAGSDGSTTADILAWGAQLEDVSGQVNVEPSEVVSSDVSVGPLFHGCFVDGVQYFTYQNDNIIFFDGAVIESQGPALSEATLNGFLSEGLSTNVVVKSEDFSNAAWVKTLASITANNAKAPTGLLTADLMTASSANATCLQAVVSGINTYCFSIWLKRKTGTGAVDLTLDGGATWTTRTITTSWSRYFITQTSVTNPTVGIRLQVSGNAVWLGNAQLEADIDFPTSSIFTNAAAVDRNADRYSISANDRFLESAGSLICEVKSNFWTTSMVDRSFISHFILYAPALITNAAVYSYDGLSSATVTNGGTLETASQKSAVKWGASERKVFKKGVGGLAATHDGSFGTAGNLTIGNSTSGLNGLCGTLKNLEIYKTALSDAELITKTLG